MFAPQVGRGGGALARFVELWESRPREVIALSLVALSAVVFAAFVVWRALPRASGSASAIIVPTPVPADASPPGEVVVHVAGAVTKPGLFRLPAGSRVADAIDAAGGATADAVLEGVNLAQPLSDGEQVLVPRRGEAMAGEASSSQPGKVNLNTATQGDLEALPGVGPVLAQRIIEYRRSHGGFRRVEDLRRVEGIGDHKFAALKDRVRV